MKLTRQLRCAVLLTSIFLYTGIGLAAQRVLIPEPPALAAKAYFLTDFDSSKVLAEHNADERLAPASLTKIMTAYVAFQELKDGNISLEDRVTISEKAWKTLGSRMFIEVNKQVEVEKLLKGVIISSGNDASVALAEHIAGNESTFADLMNQTAERLGMFGTHFVNSMGLPSPDHYSTARDLATLTRALIRDFPEYYEWHAIREFSFNNITQQNRNKLLWRDSSVDGVKTGHTEGAGYCLVASAKKGDMRLISVVMGTKSTAARASQNQALLNYGFRFFVTQLLYTANEALARARIWKGQEKMLQLGLAEDLYVTVPRRYLNDLQAKTEVSGKIMAPVSQGDTLGTLAILLGEQVYRTEPLTALKEIPLGSFFRQMYDKALLFLE